MNPEHLSTRDEVERIRRLERHALEGVGGALERLAEAIEAIADDIDRLAAKLPASEAVQ